ncbi:MAG: helix-turn-helix domain-containing protein [Fusobacteriaceae bacterium]
MKFENYLEEQLKKPELKAEYDKITPEYELISAVIKSRMEKGISQIELAKRVGTDQSRISRLEKGTLNPSLDFIKRIADGLGLELHLSFKPKLKTD